MVTVEMYGYIHIMPIGVDVGHVMAAINEPKYLPIEKIYLIHSPNDPKWEPKKCEHCGEELFKDEQPLKDIAVGLKKDLEKIGHTVILRELSPTGAFEMNPILNEITKIERKEQTELNKTIFSPSRGTQAVRMQNVLHRISSYLIE